MLQIETVKNRIPQERLLQGRGAALCPFLICLICLSIGKIGEKCLHLGSFDDRIKMLQYAQKQGVQEGEV